MLNEKKSILDTQFEKINRKNDSWYQTIYFMIKKYLLTPQAIGVGVMAGIVFFSLFCYPMIGMGDDGSNREILEGSNLYNLEELNPKESEEFFQKKWGIMEYYNDSTHKLFTSQTIFLDMAVSIDHAVSQDNIFDLRFYGGILTILFLSGIYFLFEVVTSRARLLSGYIIVGIGLLIFGDTAYIAWINSFYDQSLVCISFLLIMVSLVLMRDQKYHNVLLLSIFLVNMVILLFANYNNLILGVVLGIIGIILGQLNSLKSFKRIAIFFSVGMIVCSMIGLFIMPKNENRVGEYNRMTQGVLQTAENPEQALAYFDIDPQYAILTNTTYFEVLSNDEMNSNQMKTEFFDKQNSFNIARYYFENPGQLYQMMNNTVNQSFKVRPYWIGNYEKIQGFPSGTQANYFTFWSQLKSKSRLGNFGFISIWMFIMFTTTLLEFIKGRKEKDYRKMVLFIAVIMGMIIGLWELYQSVITTGSTNVIGGGFVFSFIFDTLTFIMLSELIRWIDGKMKDKNWYLKIKNWWIKNGTKRNNDMGF